MKRRYKAADKVRSDILKTARHFFIQYGYEKTTFKMIADELGITPGTITYHFKQKSMIVFKIFQDYLQSVSMFIRSNLLDEFNEYLASSVVSIHFFRTILHNEKIRMLFYQMDHETLWVQEWNSRTHAQLRTISDDFHGGLSDEEIHVAVLICWGSLDILLADFSQHPGALAVDKYIYHLLRLMGLMTGIDRVKLQNNIDRAFEIADNMELPNFEFFDVCD